jgi:hypothetical protein
MAASTPRFKAPTVEVPTEDSSPALSRLLDTFSPRARKLSKVGIAEVRCNDLDAAAKHWSITLAITAFGGVAMPFWL